MADLNQHHYEPWRMHLVYGGLAVAFLIFVIRLFSMQIINGQDYIEQADDNRTDNITLHAERG